MSLETYSGLVQITERCFIDGLQRQVGEVLEVSRPLFTDDPFCPAAKVGRDGYGRPIYGPIEVPRHPPSARDPVPEPAPIVTPREPVSAPVIAGPLQAHTGWVQATAPCWLEGVRLEPGDTHEVSDRVLYEDDPYRPVRDGRPMAAQYLQPGEVRPTFPPDSDAVVYPPSVRGALAEVPA